ncbi:hypothetical protein N7526_007480 [Penicillium atrosanguineum]|nr:hypothetical protein N7526_007480 [Penicillium atrosanguineum]
MHYRLAKQCLLMCQNLRKNICGLPSNRTERTEIDRQTIDSNLPPELQYASRYWAYHLAKCTDSDNIMYTAFSTELFSILDGSNESTQSYGNQSSSTLDFLHDAKRFILKNYQIIDKAPLQVYCAGLIFAPQTAMIRAQFKQEIPNWIFQLPHVKERWGTELQTLEGHSGSVQSVAFSPDSQLLASGSYDKTIRLWDPVTGVLIQSLEGHSEPVLLVTFSPDGLLLASGSYDKTIQLWDLATGVLTKSLEGHSSSVWSIAFSPDGRLLASGSEDGKVMLWDPATGVLIQSLEGHSDSVESIAFSPDGQLMASGSEDMTVRLWDPETGVLIQSLEGHSDSVESIAFSPDGQLMASGSEDMTVRLWDPETGVLTQTSNVGTKVTSVKFSSDGSYLQTNFGLLDTQPRNNISTPHPPHPNLLISIVDG